VRASVAAAAILSSVCWLARDCAARSLSLQRSPQRSRERSRAQPPLARGARAVQPCARGAPESAVLAGVSGLKDWGSAIELSGVRTAAAAGGPREQSASASSGRADEQAAYKARQAGEESGTRW
jgi:hypothetical protein